MNLFIINESSHGAIYGIGTYIRELTTALRYSCMNVCVVNLKSNKQQIQAEKINSIWHWYFPMPVPPEKLTTNYKKQGELYYRNIAYLLQLYIEDRKNLIFHLNFNQSGKLAKELKKSFDCRIILTIHWLDWCLILFGNILRLRKILATRNDELKKRICGPYRKEKALFEIVDHIICLSENTLQILLDEYQINQTKVTIINNGLTDINLTFDKQILRQKYNIPNIPIILFAGRVDEIKGLMYALRAFKIVLNKYPNCHFMIAGSGEFDMYMRECEDIWMHVTWTGLLSKDKLYELYSIADIGVMPSFHEQCSYVAIEMMRHSLPIIGSTSTGLKEMIADGETGLHIPVIEYDDKSEIDTSLLAEKMLFLLQNPGERQRMGQNARKRYEEHYSMDVFRKNMLDFYHSLLNQKPDEQKI